MTKKELQNRRAEIVRSLNNYCDTIAQEKRNFTDEEKLTVRELESEKDSIEIALRNFDNRREFVITDAISEAAHAIRSVARREANDIEINLRAISGATTTSTVAGVAAESTAGVLEPLEKGLILDKIGAQIRTDLRPGDKWAVVAPAQATFEGEATELSTQSINVTKKATTPHRIGVKVCVTNAALEMSDIDLMNRVVMPEVQKTIRRELNAWMFSTTAYNITHNASGAVATAATKATFKGAIPTAAELAQLRGKVKAKGVYDDGSYRYVMSSLMAAELSVTPIVEGGSRMILEDGKIGGVPVFETEYIEHGNTAIDTKGAKYVAFGRWSDAVVAQFGAARVVVDSNSVAAGSVDGTWVVLNVYYDMVSLYDGKSFGLGTATLS